MEGVTTNLGIESWKNKTYENGIFFSELHFVFVDEFIKIDRKIHTMKQFRNTFAQLMKSKQKHSGK